MRNMSDIQVCKQNISVQQYFRYMYAKFKQGLYKVLNKMDPFDYVCLIACM